MDTTLRAALSLGEVAPCCGVHFDGAQRLRRLGVGRVVERQLVLHSRKGTMGLVFW